MKLDLHNIPLFYENFKNSIVNFNYLLNSKNQMESIIHELDGLPYNTMVNPESSHVRMG